MSDQRVRQFVTEYLDLTRSAANEEEIRSSFVASAVSALAIRDLKTERGRQDVRRNHIIIEFKDKGLFYGTKTSAKFLEASNQLIARYIPAQARLDGAEESDYIGVCFDGVHLAFVFVEDSGTPRISELRAFDERSAAALVLALDRDDRIQLTPENVAADFGPASAVARDMLNALWFHFDASLSAPVVNRIQMLFDEWTDLFQQSTGLGTLGQAQMDDYLRSLGIPPRSDPTRVLFVLHTYHALFFKLLAVELVLANSLLAGIPTDFSFRTSALDDAALLTSLGREIEDSLLFRQVNILNFVEGSFFAWYLHGSPPPALVEAIRSMLRRLSLYRLSGLKLDRTRDIVKRIYQQLVPRSLRKNIGEFFTPEWLVEFTLDRAGYRGPVVLTGKYLDPCCGSGTFLIHAIDRFKSEARAAGWSDQDILDGIIDHIFGFDLNPLAVLTARVNYLIAISDLIATHSDVEIPIYQADSVYAPTVSTGGLTGPRTREYRIGTRLNTIEVELPEDLIQRNRLFARVLGTMERTIQLRGSEVDFITLLGTEPDYASDPERATWEPYLRDMFRKVEELERQDWNRIWCRIVRNHFSSVAIGKCEFVAGNPPWVRWSALPARYAERIKPTCDAYGIFSVHRYHGGNELDISGMITYTVADNWLADGGRLAFVITQTHFQSQSSGGFRRFEVMGTPLGVLSVDDWSKVKPWPDLGNKPAVLSLLKGRTTTYPVDYIVWRRNSAASIPEDATWTSAQAQLQQAVLEANPLSGPGERWSIMPPGRFQQLRVLDGADPYVEGRKGITTDLNGAFFVELIGPGRTPQTMRFRNLPTMGRKDVPEVTGEIELDLIFPLLKGAENIRAFQVSLDQVFVIVPNTGITPMQVGTTSSFGMRFPRALQYFRAIEATQLLSARSTWRNYMLPGYERLVNAGTWLATDIPFFAIYNVGSYTFAPYKVVWAEIAGSLEAAVISSATVPYGEGRKSVVPDHKVYFASFDDEDHAHYICALLNSEPVRTFVDSFTVKLQVGSLFDHVRLPQYDPNDANHSALVTLSKRAHLTSAGQSGGIDALRTSVDQIADVLLS